jgi:hypothetical protein
LVNSSKLVDPGPAYPTKSIKTKSFAWLYKNLYII